MRGEEPPMASTSSLRVVALERTNPDVAIADRVAVILQRDRSRRVAGRVRKNGLVRRRAPERRGGVDRDAVVQDGDDRGRVERAARREARRGEGDVVGLPFPWRTRGIHERRKLAVHRGRLAVGIRNVVVAVEYLDLEHAEQEYTAVAAPLAIAFDDRRRREFDVQLNVGEVRLLRADHPLS